MAKKPKKAPKPTKPRGKPGPRPEVLKIEGNWKAAIKKAIGRGKPS